MNVQIVFIAEFSASLLQSSVSHDLSEIINMQVCSSSSDFNIFVEIVINHLNIWSKIKKIFMH